ncbi:MAG: hypothetical protein FWD60_06235 [Candidatus Azobacteroides sp.]|nr:hypothetical protein [Candidatus Azobacteroides sp.]
MKKSTFKLLMVAIILCLPLLKSVAQTIQISSAADLQKIGVDAANYPLNGSYELTGDIDMSDVKDWVPIGMSAGRTFGAADNTIANFTGTFDGKGYAIKNLTYSFSGTYVGGTNNTDELTGGIFGRIANATVKNLELRNLTITGNCAGALAASIAIATVNNVSVIGCTITGDYEVGGITGRTNNSPQTIIDCYVDQTTTIKGKSKVGGLVGFIYQNGTINMTNCYAAATLESTSDPAYGLLGATNSTGVINLKSVFVMAQATAGTTLKPFGPLLSATSADYYACSDYFPAETYPELYPVEETDPSFVKTLAELQTEATYADLGWDFDNIWQIAAGEFPTFKVLGTDAINIVKAGQLWNANGLNNSIEVTVSEPMFLSVYDITGKALFAAQVSNQVSIPASKGIYIIKGKETVQKILVK